jgi:diguanylate cyclase (GGDEF)-like protein
MGSEGFKKGRTTDTTTAVDTDVVTRVREESDPDRQAYLIVISGPHVGRMVQVGEAPVLVGRGESADLQLHDRGVSREHARLVPAEDGVYLRDLDSSNGTYVNGSELTGVHKLEDDDKVTLGTATILKFAYQDEFEETYQRKMYEASLRDGLTDVYNKEYLREYLRSELSFARRHDTPLCLVMFDIDEFKPVNDTYGHLAGDRILEQLAERIDATIRDEDTLARYGGDEFVVVCRGIEREGGMELGERIRRTIADTPFEYRDEPIPISVSVGVANRQDARPDNADDFIDAVDQAMYRAKHAGRNTTRYG